jgi:glycosyltransferase involved in cell wall biosynthesis
MTERLDVLFLCTNSDCSGAPLYVKNLAVGCKAKELRVLVAMGGEGPIFRMLAEEGVSTIRVPFLKSSLNFLLDIFPLIVILRLLIRYRPKILNCHSAKAAFLGRLAAIFMKTRVVYTVHGWGFGKGRRRIVSNILRVVERVFAKKTDLFVTVSRADEDAATKILHIEREKLCSLPVGIPPPSHVVDHQYTSYVTKIARFSTQKDYETFFRALAGTNFPVSVVGARTDTSECKSLARRLCGESFANIKFYGNVNDLGDILNQTRVLVLSSNYEGMPAVLIEAQSLGIPCVASDVGGVGQIITHSKNGFIFPPGDYVSLRSQIVRLMENDQDVRRVGRSGIENFKSKHRLEDMVESYTHIFSKCVEQGG